MNQEIKKYNAQQTSADNLICNLLAETIDKELKGAESKMWHAHPVWFLDGNPIVGYSKQKAGLRLMFWSGADFEEETLSVKGKKFKDASIFYTDSTQVNVKDLKRWLKKAREIQWDYKNVVKRKGRLEKIK
jgi:isocitrate lyase